MSEILASPHKKLKHSHFHNMERSVNIRLDSKLTILARKLGRYVRQRLVGSEPVIAPQVQAVALPLVEVSLDLSSPSEASHSELLEAPQTQHQM